ncbi:MAG TPA: trimeric intracellular cation channel family protein [Pseudonocardia sp.]|nr:trimeric intracellular cation channel family protein [Pseudonocardia sp.]
MLALTPVLQVLDLVGVFAFATSGALVAVRREFDVVGMAVLACVTALGGGVVRDLVIGAVPPAAFTELGYVVVPASAVLLTFVAHRMVERLGRVVLILDAVGLGVFSVTGALKALAHGLGPVQAVGLGVVTAIGGGILRDVVAGERPAVLRRDSELYAVPAALAAALAVTGDRLGVDQFLIAAGAPAVAFVVRLLALRFHWRAPRLRRATP